MAGTSVTLGPFIGGLNLLEDPRIIADNQMAECINLDIGRGGELTVRPGLKAVRTFANPVTENGAEFIRLIDAVTMPTGFSRLYVREYGAVTNYVWYKNDPSTAGAWTLLDTTAAVEVGVIIQYVDVINTTVPYAYLVPRGAGAVGVRQNLNTNATNTISGMPRGSGAIVFRERLFIFGSLIEEGLGNYRVYYSAAGDFSSWPVNNFFDVGPGDGDFVSAMAIQGDSLIVFKRRSTWALYFDSDPFLGQLRKINNEIGCTGPEAVATFQSELFVIGRRSIYRMINLLFDDIGRVLDLQRLRAEVDFNQYHDTINGVGSSIVACVATGGGIIPFKYFVYQPDLQAWSEYRFSEFPERFLTVLDGQTVEHQYATKKNSPNLYDYKPFTKLDSDWGDFPDNVTFVSMATKKLGWTSASEFKRMFWWTIETLGNNKDFSMYTVADDQRQSATAVRKTASNIRAVAKAFITNRFRTMQFFVTSSTPGLRMTIFEARANLAEKREVSTDVTN